MDSAAMLSILDDHGFGDTATARKVEALQATVDEICAREPWPFLEKQNSTFSLSTSTPTMPTDFRAALSLIIPSVGQVVVPERLDTITKNYPSSLTATGVPFNYYFVANQLTLLPAPDTTYTALLTYLCTHPTITSTSAETVFLIPPRHHRLIVTGTLVKLYMMEDDADLAQGFASEFERLMAVMESDVWKKQYDRTDRVVDVWDDWDV